MPKLSLLLNGYNSFLDFSTTHLIISTPTFKSYLQLLVLTFEKTNALPYNSIIYISETTQGVADIIQIPLTWL